MGTGEKMLAGLEEQLVNCMKCGNCMEVCPIYKELGYEGGAARGKLAVIEAVNAGKLALGDAFGNLMALCTSCKACSTKCPCGVKPDEMILRAREAAVEACGLPAAKQAGFALLKNRRLFHAGMRLAGTFGKIVFKKVPGRIAAIPRMHFSGQQVRTIAPVAEKPLRSLYPENVAAIGAKKLRVGYFTGCMANYIYTDIGRSVVDVLAANGIEVVLPKQQHCCGTPAHSSGDIKTAKALARENIEVFGKYRLDYIITSCGSCAQAWKTVYPHFFQTDAALQTKAKALANKTYEISQFLVDVVPFDREMLGTIEETVTLHDPCHMVRGIKVSRQPRDILSAIPGLKLVEMDEASRCCGAGGSFCLTHYNLSRKINDRKIENIKKSEAQIVATGCGSCRMHITDGLVRHGIGQSVLHTIQLLDLSYKKHVQGEEKNI